MKVLIQKHRSFPIWKFYSEDRSYLGQIQGDDKSSIGALAEVISDLLLGKEVKGYNKNILSDGSMNITNSEDKRVAAFDKEFISVGEAIKNQ
jgi:hypothetical protein